MSVPVYEFTAPDPVSGGVRYRYSAATKLDAPWSNVRVAFYGLPSAGADAVPIYEWTATDKNGTCYAISNTAPTSSWVQGALLFYGYPSSGAGRTPVSEQWMSITGNAYLQYTTGATSGSKNGSIRFYAAP